MTARARVILTSAVTWLILAQVVAQAVLDELGDELPADWVAAVARLLVFVGGVVAVIRRVTPVLPDERGLV